VPSTASCHAVFPSSSGIQGIDGLKSLKATYVPSGDFAASYDTLTGSQTGLTASNPAPNSGDNFTLTATVNSLGTSGDPAAGSVLFFENGSSTPLPDCGGASGEALKGGTGADANTASCTLSRPTASYSYTVVYNPPSSGNGFGGSLSGPANVAVN
jgi:hypothetical protein